MRIVCNEQSAVGLQNASKYIGRKQITGGFGEEITGHLHLKQMGKCLCASCTKKTYHPERGHE